MPRVEPDSDNLTATPLEHQVSEAFASKLRAAGLGEATVAELVRSFAARRTPSAEVLLEALKSPSSTEEAAE